MKILLAILLILSASLCFAPPYEAGVDECFASLKKGREQLMKLRKLSSENEDEDKAEEYGKLTQELQDNCLELSYLTFEATLKESIELLRMESTPKIRRRKLEVRYMWTAALAMAADCEGRDEVREFGKDASGHVEDELRAWLDEHVDWSIALDDVFDQSVRSLKELPK